MPKPIPPAKFKLGEHVKVSVPGGQVVDAVIKAVIPRTDGAHYQIDFGNSRTALVAAWQAMIHLLNLP